MPRRYLKHRSRIFASSKKTVSETDPLGVLKISFIRQVMVKKKVYHKLSRTSLVTRETLLPICEIWISSGKSDHLLENLE